MTSLITKGMAFGNQTEAYHTRNVTFTLLDDVYKFQDDKCYIPKSLLRSLKKKPSPVKVFFLDTELQKHWQLRLPTSSSSSIFKNSTQPHLVPFASQSVYSDRSRRSRARHQFHKKNCAASVQWAGVVCMAYKSVVILYLYCAPGPPC